MIGPCLFALFPAFVLSKSVVSADITEVQVCQYFDARIERFEEKVKEMKALVDVDSEFYRTLEASNLCDTVGRVAVPECVANREGDVCAAAKIESLKKPLLRAIKVDKSGKEFFDYCKYIGYKNVLKTFLKTRKLMSGECGLPGQKSSGDREGRNSLLLPLLVAGAYDPSSIWFQYFLCKDQQIYCYFFTQGWNQYEYGQYYLYENLLDDTDGIFGGSSDSSNLATLALLGGLGGSSYNGHYPSPGGYSQGTVGRKGRSSGEQQCTPGVDGCPERERRSESCTLGDVGCPEERKRRSEPCKPGDVGCPEERKRRSEPCKPGYVGCPEERNRRSEPCKPGEPGCPEERKRRSEPCKSGQPGCPEERKRRSEPCKSGEPGCPEERKRRSERCKPGDVGCPEERKRRSEPCQPGEVGCPEDRNRRSLTCRDPEDMICCVDGEWICF